jgi:carbamoyltransferase
MGLSAYGKNFIDEIKNFIIDDDKQFFKLNLNYFNIKNFPLKKTEGKPHYDSLLTNKAYKYLSNLKKNYKGNFDEDLSFTVQKIYEKYFQDILFYINSLNCNNLVFSGGCAQNSLANRLIKNFKNIKNIYIPPVATDAGTGLGATMSYYFQNNNQDHKEIDNSSPYLGESIDNDQVDNLVSNLKKRS